jgi:hypothetical protein
VAVGPAVAGGLARGDRVSRPRVVYLGNAVSLHSVAFLRELHRLGADVRLVVSSRRAGAARRGPLARIGHVLSRFTLDEILTGVGAALCEGGALGQLGPCGRLRERHSLSWTAAQLGFAHLGAASVNVPEVVSRVAAAQPDVLLVHSFSEIVRPPLVATARIGAFNFHPGRLPQLRGPHPLEHAVLRGEREVWTTCHFLAAEVDAGDVVLSTRQELTGVSSWAEVQGRSFAATARALREFLEGVARGPLPRTAQDRALACYCPRVTAREKYRARWLARRVYRVPA